MKRKLPIIIALIAVLAISAVGCGGLGRITVQGTQDTSYIVLSNGGSAVQYGNYVYFINGYDGYDDENGKSNTFNRVEKGAIYRAELVGNDIDRVYNLASGEVTKKTFLPRRSDKGNPFKTTTHNILKGYEVDEDGEYLKDENDEYIEKREPVEYADVQLIGPKRIGTTGYAEGGIFIFDDYIFYASPNNKKNRTGTVQTQTTDFYRAKLNGSKTELIYTTENDTTSSEYMFYKYSGHYYLVVKDGTKVKSIKMGKKITDPYIIGEGVTSVHFPNKKIYYTDMPENTVEDFIYIIRETTKSDTTSLGNVLEVKRPDGSSPYTVSASGRTASILGTDNGMFFYKLNDTIVYTNLAEVTNEILDENGEYLKDNSGNNLTLPEGVKKTAGEFDFSASMYSTVKCINPNPKNIDDVYILGFSSEGLFIVDRVGNARQLHTTEATLVSVEGNYVYFTSGIYENGSLVNYLCRVDMFVQNAQVVGMHNTDGINTAVTFKYDILPDFVVYFADIDAEAAGYTYFKELSDPSAEGNFIGYRIDADTIPEEDLYPPEEE